MFGFRGATEYTWGSGGLPRGPRGAGRLPAQEPSSLPRSLFTVCWVLSVQQPVAPSRPLGPAGAAGLGPLWRSHSPSPPLVLTHGLPGSIPKPKAPSELGRPPLPAACPTRTRLKGNGFGEK